MAGKDHMKRTRNKKRYLECVSWNKMPPSTVDRNLCKLSVNLQMVMLIPAQPLFFHGLSFDLGL